MSNSSNSQNDPEDLEYNRDLAREHKQRLQELKKKAARYGDSVEPQVTIEIKKIEKIISEINLEIIKLERQELERNIKIKEQESALISQKRDGISSITILALILCSVALVLWAFTGNDTLVISITACVGACVTPTLIILGR